MNAVFKSVRFKMLASFMLIVAPLVFFLVYNNLYSIDTVRDQVSQNYGKLLAQYVKDSDGQLKEFNYYWYMLSTWPDLVNMQMNNLSSDDYTLAKQQLYNKYINDIGYYNIVNTFFLYSQRHDDLLIATKEITYYYDFKKTITDYVAETLRDGSKAVSLKWRMVPTASGTGLIQMSDDLGGGLYGGVLIEVNSLAKPLSLWDVGSGGGVMVTTKEEGEPLTPDLFPPSRFTAFQTQLNPNAARPYQIVGDPDSQQHYLQLSESSKTVDLQYNLFVNESTVLRNLPYLQRTLYVIPVVVVVVLAFYLLFLQRIFFKPMALLIRSMRKIGQGRLDIRLKADVSNEFGFFISTFNDMLGQIENLKINVYEEKLRVQQAEFRRLQAQINPHFYMNSLNIVYNLAALKEYKSVQKMALHLAEYFRFIMQTRSDWIPLADELAHIRNYLEIQAMRYPDLLTCEIAVPNEFHAYPVLPLVVQPFVENSVIHGFRKDGGDIFRISIAAEADPGEPVGRLLIRIRDNGCGFSQDMLDMLNSEQYLEQSREQHLGIWNVLNRLRMHYGPKASVTFVNGLPQHITDIRRGAVVTIALPISSNI